MMDEPREPLSKADSIERKLDALSTSVDQRFETVDRRLETIEKRLDTIDDRIMEEGKTTRRHFDIVAEQFKDYVRVLADGIARTSERLDGHEQRLTALETRSGASA